MEDISRLRDLQYLLDTLDDSVERILSTDEDDCFVREERSDDFLLWEHHKEICREYR